VFEVVTDAQVTVSGDQKILTWNKSLIENKTTIEYSYSIPLEFPKLYPLGPIEISYDSSIFTEARPWFVAADPAFNVGNAAASNAQTFEFGITPTATVDTLLVVGIGWRDNGGTSTPTVLYDDTTGCTNAPVPLTALPGSRANFAQMFTEIFYLTSPAITPHFVCVDMNEAISHFSVAGGVVYSDVYQASPFGTVTTNAATSGTKTITVTGVDRGNGAFSVFSVRADTTVTTTAGTQRWNLNGGGGTGSSIGVDVLSPAGSSATMTMGSVGDGRDFAISGVEINRSPLKETITITPTITNAFTKTLTESITIMDTVLTVSAFIQTPTETITITDTITNAFTKTLTESITIVDTVIPTSALTQTLTETITITPALTNAFTKTLTETVTIADTVLTSGALTQTLSPSLQQ